MHPGWRPGGGQQAKQWVFLDKRTGTTRDIMNRGENGKDAPGFFFRGSVHFLLPTLYVQSEANDHVLWDQQSMMNFIL